VDTPDKLALKKRGRPPGKPSVESRVIEACTKHWLAKQPKNSQAIKGIKIPEAGPAELLLQAPAQGTLLLIARSWAHAAAFAHVVGQAVGGVAHLMNAAPGGPRALLEGADPAPDPAEARQIGARLVEDASAGRLGIVFAIGFTDHEGDEQVRKRLVPVLSLLDRWAEKGAPGLAMGVHLWAVRLSEDGDDAKVEPLPLRPSGKSKKE
jgi:hypothetical protein